MDMTEDRPSGVAVGPTDPVAPRDEPAGADVDLAEFPELDEVPELGRIGRILALPLVPFVALWEAARAFVRAVAAGGLWLMSAVGRARELRGSGCSCDWTACHPTVPSRLPNRGIARSQRGGGRPLLVGPGGRRSPTARSAGGADGSRRASASSGRRTCRSGGGAAGWPGPPGGGPCRGDAGSGARAGDGGPSRALPAGGALVREELGGDCPRGRPGPDRSAPASRRRVPGSGACRGDAGPGTRAGDGRTGAAVPGGGSDLGEYGCGRRARRWPGDVGRPPSHWRRGTSRGRHCSDSAASCREGRVDRRTADRLVPRIGRSRDRCPWTTGVGAGVGRGAQTCRRIGGRRDRRGAVRHSPGGLGRSTSDPERHLGRPRGGQVGPRRCSPRRRAGRGRGDAGTTCGLVAVAPGASCRDDGSSMSHVVVASGRRDCEARPDEAATCCRFGSRRGLGCRRTGSSGVGQGVVAGGGPVEAQSGGCSRS